MLRIRLARRGRKKRPQYRVVVAEARWARDGRRVDDLGWYNPMTDPSTVVLDVERTEDWIRKGAQPSERVTKLLAIAKAGTGSPPAPHVAEPAPVAVEQTAVAAEAEAAAPPEAPAPIAEAAPKAAAEAEGQARQGGRQDEGQIQVRSEAQGKSEAEERRIRKLGRSVGRTR